MSEPKNLDDDIDLLLLITALGHVDDLRWQEALLRRLSESPRWGKLLERDRFARELFQRGPFNQREQRLREAREVAVSVLEGFRRSEDRRFSELQHKISDLQGIQTKIEKDLSERITASSAELHAYLWLASAGADLRSAQIRRYIPARMYVSDPLPDQNLLDELTQDVNAFAAMLGYELADELPERKGSWFKELFYRSKSIATSPEVKQGAMILAEGQVAKHGWMPQAEVERVHAEIAKMHAEAEKIKADAELSRAQAQKIRAEAENLAVDRLQKLQQSMEKFPGSVCVQIDRYIGIKITDDKETSVAIIHLNDEALKQLAQNSSMLGRPHEVLLWLRGCHGYSIPTTSLKTYTVQTEEAGPLVLNKQGDRY